MFVVTQDYKINQLIISCLEMNNLVHTLFFSWTSSVSTFILVIKLWKLLLCSLSVTGTGSLSEMHLQRKEVLKLYMLHFSVMQTYPAKISSKEC